MGKDPHDTCADETATKPCGNDGTCDGKGACRKVGTSHVCIAASCSADEKTFTPTTTCDGAGACTTATPQPCGLSQCTTTGCLQNCTTASDCASNSYCNTSVTPSVCAAKKTPGQPAAQKAECTSNFVADGVCCDQDCTGCKACTAALNKQPSASDGQCLAVLAGEVGHGTCTASPPCGLDGKCDGNGGCRYPAAGTSCASNACSADHSSQTTNACDSTHACAATTAGCKNGLTCDSTTGLCKSSCSTDGDCTAGKFCVSGACALKPKGTSCTSAAQCASNFCVDGYCCDGACTGSCQACNLAGVLGTCTNLAAGATPQSGHPACTASDPRCPSSCQGGSACAYTNNTSCGQSTCGSDHLSYQAAGTCSNGTCNVPTSAPCGSGKYCTGVGSCVTQKSAGTCANNYECLSNNCSGGVCCGPGKTGCNGTCTDVNADSANCGSCGNACSSVYTCIQSHCCYAGNVICSGACADLANDPANCGSCGHTCASGQGCSGSICCNVPLDGCNGVCVNEFTDSNNCGSCGHVCGPGMACNGGGDCRLADGQTGCTDNSQCAHQNCSVGLCCPQGQGWCDGACVVGAC